MRKIKNILLSMYIKIIEKRYSVDGKEVKYVFQHEPDSKKLIVIFSAFPGGEKPSYNYIRTLKDLKENKLFILDDFGYKGSYYLMEHGNEYVLSLCLKLIESIRSRVEAQIIITCGSSKGGTAALLYGLKLGVKYVCIGAPQYYIGKYLNDERHIKILQSMLPSNYTKQDIEALNEVLQHSIRICNNKPIIYIHYSKNEHTYKEHIRDMITALRLNDFSIYENIENYENHKDVAIYYPPYLKQTLSEITK